MLSNLNGPLPSQLNKLWVGLGLAVFLVVTGLMLLTVTTLGHLLVGVASLLLGGWSAYCVWQALNGAP